MEKSHHASREATTRKMVRGCLLAASCFVSTFALGSPVEAAGKDSTPSHDALPMTSFELYTLYRDKSWKWPAGAGRLQADGRRFTAWSGSGNKASWAEGRWTVNDRGQLCLKAQWHLVSGVFPNTTCFSHRKLGDIIYQKREPAGAWYVFKHATPTEGDEFNELIGDDLVSQDLQQIRSSLASASKTNPVARTKL
jgi:hypothetical protein